VMGVLQGAAGSSDFFVTSAQAVVDIAALDSGAVMMWRSDHWELMARSTAPGVAKDDDWYPSHRLLGRVKLERRTFWQPPLKDTSLAAGSLADLQALVAAPILDRLGQVIGVLYGDRRHRGGLAPAPHIGRMEAMLIEVVACGVAAGLARLEQEQAALAAQVRFEQFFGPALARLLQTRPDMLDARTADVTVLFCDIRGFSRISGRVGSARTVEWISDVMGVLSDCVQQHDGVLVDYVGDELIAMWGAPQEQPDHAARACQAGLDMLERVPELNARWQPVLGEPMDLGVGINSGPAHVGNVGSQRKFKYGPLGNTVNIASRIQGVNKYVGTRLLVSGATREHLEPETPARRVCRARLVNIQEDVDLYEVAPPDREGHERLHAEYESALTAWEAGDASAALAAVERLLVEFPNDGPARELRRRASAVIATGAADGSPAWEFTSK
jgi:adenylate cyclase